MGKDLEVVGFVRQCELGTFLGKKSYSEKLIPPKNGIFVNQIDMSRFEKTPHHTLLQPGESPFYIDYSFPNLHNLLDDDTLNKLRDLKRVKELGKNAEETLGHLLNKYGISESDL